MATYPSRNFDRCGAGTEFGCGQVVGDGDGSAHVVVKGRTPIDGTGLGQDDGNVIFHRECCPCVVAPGSGAEVRVVSAAIKCDGCGKFEDAAVRYLNRLANAEKILPKSWLLVGLGRTDEVTAEHRWEVCSMACAVLVVARLAERGGENRGDGES